MKRIYVPLPERDTRFQLISNLIQKHVSSGGGNCKLSNNSISKIVQLTEGYSASDLTAVSLGSYSLNLNDVNTDINTVDCVM